METRFRKIFIESSNNAEMKDEEESEETKQ
jgi:hypothetical protein